MNFMRPNKNNDISIEDISKETIEMVFKNNPDKFLKYLENPSSSDQNSQFWAFFA